MNNTTPNKSQLMVPWIIWVYFLASAAILHGVVLSGAAQPPTNSPKGDELLIPFAAVTLALVIAALWVRSRLIKQARSQGLASSFTLFIVGLVFCEASVVLGFVIGYFGSVESMLNLSLPATALLVSFCPAFVFPKPK
jgi:hypothetical protein